MAQSGTGVSVKTTAELLDCSKGAVRRWMREGKLGRIKVHGWTHVRTQDVVSCIRLGLQPQETH